MGLEPGQSCIEEGYGAFLALVGQHGGEGQPRGIVDGDVEVFPAGAALAALPDAVAGDAVADAVDRAKLLDVDMGSGHCTEPRLGARARKMIAGLGSRVARRLRPSR